MTTKTAGCVQSLLRALSASLRGLTLAFLICLTSLALASSAWGDALSPPSGDAIVPAASGTTCSTTGSETVSTDRSSYPNYDTVQVSGTGYAADCQVTVPVTRPDGSVVTGDGTETPGSDDVPTGADGTFSYAYRLAGIDGAYTVDVLAQDGSVLATTRFMDAFGINKLSV